MAGAHCGCTICHTALKPFVHRGHKSGGDDGGDDGGGGGGGCNLWWCSIHGGDSVGVCGGM